jgi:transcriptional regulator with XRE-family HTH domain
MVKSLYTKRREQLTKRLIDARIECGLTQNDVAKTSIISQSELSKIENGQRKVEFLVLVDLAKLYNKDLDFFIPK